MGLMAHPNAKHAVTPPISLEANQALGRAEEELLHKGGDPVSVMNEIQAESAPKLKKGLSYLDTP
jgi:hypothetical protein